MMMTSEAATCAERATSDMLIGPDWSVNIELCDIINGNPGQANDAIKVLKRQLGSRNPQVQLLTLDVLDSLSKNCGNKIFQEISNADILQDLINVIYKKPDLRVREKVLSLIDTWQEALGGPVGSYPQYYAAYMQLVNAGVKFPPREKNNVTLFTPPQNRPVANVNIVHHEAPVQASPQTDMSPLSVTEFKSASELADILKEMLGALGPHDSEGAKEEVVMDLVDQCRSYQQRVMILLNSTSDEDLLFQGLALNDTLLNVLHQHENLAKGISPIVVTRPAPIPHVSKVHTNDCVDDDLGQLAQRSKARKALRKTGSMPVSPLLPPPPSSKNPVVKDSNFVDFLSGDLFTSETSGLSTKEALNELPTNPSSNTNAASQFSPPNAHDDPFWLGEGHGENSLKEPPSATKSSFSPPSSAQTDTSFDFFDQLASHSSPPESTVSFGNSIEAPMQSLKLNPDTSTETKEKKPDDDPFKDLLDFARAKPSTPSSSSRSNERLS